MLDACRALPWLYVCLLLVSTSAWGGVCCWELELRMALVGIVDPRFLLAPLAGNSRQPGQEAIRC